MKIHFARPFTFFDKVFKVLNKWTVGLIVLAMGPATAIAADPCAGSLLPASYRQEAARVKDAKISAAVSDAAGTSSSFAVDVMNVPAAPSGNRYAAFYMPPSLAASAILGIEKAAVASGVEPDLKNTHGALLLVPLTPSDCRFFVLATPGWDGSMRVGTALRRIDADALTRFLDDLFRVNWPAAPAVKDIEANGMDSTKYAAQFATLMQMPVVVSDAANVLDRSAPVIVTESNALPLLPESAIWRLETSKFAWPASLKALVSRADAFMPDFTRIISEPLSQKSKTQLEADLSTLHEILISMQTMGDLAMADLTVLKAELPPKADDQTKAIYGQLLAVLDRMAVAQYSSLVSAATSQYEQTYAKLYEVPKPNALAPFDASKLVGYYPKGVATKDKLTTLTLSDMSKLIPKAPKEVDGGQAYMAFTDYKDPVTQTAQIRPEFTMVFKSDALIASAQAELLGKIPANNCERRIQHDPIQWSSDKGSLLGTMDVRLELWTCIKHVWVCFKAWTPRICKNEIKIPYLKTHGTIRLTATAMPRTDGIALNYLSDVPYVGTEMGSRLVPLDTTKLRDGSLGALWTLNQIYFTTRSGSGELLVVVLGNAPALDGDVANIAWENIKNSLTNKGVK
ncbi:hypothetical protein PMI16_01939 [Herbaspirillum sp. CF444]|uniref:hypothetical protein n=1 Tax=Herbaspirillum sp. CF444 TaxID=1144319 RepID=UPI0002724BC1|nr:hypothetical protein [Herbaspirillum sp. CF444]EJL89747.1 hypothetical protein PMI16_01939 [Herbaspirillum sp. CF444]